MESFQVATRASEDERGSASRAGAHHGRDVAAEILPQREGWWQRSSNGSNASIAVHREERDGIIPRTIPLPIM